MQFTTQMDGTVYEMARHHDSAGNLVFAARAEEKTTAMLFRIANPVGATAPTYNMGWTRDGETGAWSYSGERDPRVSQPQKDKDTGVVLIWQCHTAALVQTRELKDLALSYIRHAFLLQQHGGIPNWDRARFIPERKAMLCVNQENCLYMGECSFAHGLGALRLRFCGHERMHAGGCPMKKRTVVCKQHVVPRCLHFHRTDELCAQRESNFAYVEKIHNSTSPLVNDKMPIATIKGMSGGLAKFINAGNSCAIDDYDMQDQLQHGVIRMPGFLASSLGINGDGVISGARVIRATLAKAVVARNESADSAPSLRESLVSTTYEENVTQVIGHAVLRRLHRELQKIEGQSSWMLLCEEELSDRVLVACETRDVALLQEIQRRLEECFHSPMYYAHGNFQFYAETQSHKQKKANEESAAFAEPGKLFGREGAPSVFKRMRKNDSQKKQFKLDKYGRTRQALPASTDISNAGYYGTRGGSWLKKINSSNVGHKMTGARTSAKFAPSRAGRRTATYSQEPASSQGQARKPRRRGRNRNRAQAKKPAGK